MWRARPSHGIAGLEALADGSCASASAVIAGCSRGSSRKYQSHIASQTSVAATSTKKAARQEKAVIRPATISAVAALPIREKVWVMPCANPQRPRGVQADIARVAAG